MNERDVFIAALQKDLPAERRAYLDEACRGDEVLRRGVEALLDIHERSGGFLDGPALSPVATIDEPLTERPGTVIGSYKLLEQIGEGGFGLVFLAEQQQPVRRKVAVKVLKPGMDTRQVIARFEAERQALALMDHANIARVLDAGETASGRPHFVMELVRGVPITDYCDQNRLTTRERLELFTHVCQAVQHAHQKGIIHRDIKPSNVMVTLHDGVPVVKVIDFGIAKALGQQLTDKTLYTGFAQMIGTPMYMSPEQAQLSGLDIDTRSDIYSLGVLLYELLTGTTPFDKERLHAAGYDEMRRIIREEEPPRPSTRLSTLGPAAATVSEQRRSDPRRLSQILRGDLDWILMKSLEKDRNRRYETANAFAADVQHYLHDEPVAACPPSSWYRFRKFARRNKRELVTTGLVLLFLVSVGIGAGWMVRERAAREQELARDRSARQARAANELELALDRGELFQEQGKRAEALAALERAELLAAEAPTDPVRNERLTALKERLAADAERLAAEARDADFFARFEDIRLRVNSQVNVQESRFAPEAVVPEIAKALRLYGIAIGDISPADAAAHVQGRPEPVRRNLIAAFDYYLRWAPKDDAPTQQWLLDTLAAADNDAWRVQVRKSTAAHDWKALEKLAHEADVPEQPPSFLVFVADSLPRPSRLEMLGRIQLAYPGDLWANHSLAFELWANGRPVESVPYYTAALALGPRNPGIYLNRGAALQSAGLLDAAIADFRQSVALAPQYARAYSNLGKALYAKGQLDKAFAALSKAIELDPKAAPAFLSRGVAYADSGQWDKALADYTTAITLDPKNPAALTNRGLAYAALDQWDKALADYTTAIERDPGYAAAFNNRGAAYGYLGQTDNALADFTKAIDLDPKNVGMDRAGLRARVNRADAYLKLQLWDKALADYTSAIALDPKYGHLWHSRGVAYADSGQWDKALADFSTAIAWDPKSPAAFNSRGVAYGHLGQRDKALADYTKAIELDTKHVPALCGRGLVYAEMKEWPKALADYTKVIELDPNHVLALYSRGLVFAEMKEWRQAHADYTKAIEVDGKQPGCWYRRGVAYANLGQRDKALADYTKAIELDPKVASAFLDRGLAYAQLGQWDKAVADVTKAIELDPKDAGLHKALAWWLATAADPEVRDQGRALGSAKKAVELAPNEGDNWNTLGVAHYRVGDWQAALESLAKSMELRKGGDSVDWFFLAMCHEKLGDKEEARQWYDRASSWPDKNEATNEELRRFQTEAAGVLGVDEKKASAEAAALVPKNAELHRWMADVLANLGKRDAAINEYQKAIDLDPKNAGAHLGLAEILWAQGKRDQAIAEYRKATEQDQTNDYLLYKLGVALKEDGDLDGGIAEFRRAWTLNPSGWGARDELLQAYVRRGQPKEIDEWRAAWQQALERTPPEHDAWFGYAELCLYLGRDEEYRRHRKDLLARFGDTTDPVIAERVARACLLLPASGDELERAATLADRAVAAGSESGFYGHSLAAKGLAEYRLGRFDSAIDWLKQAEACGVFMPITRLVLAMARDRSGQTRQARETLDAALIYNWSEATGDNHEKLLAHILRREAEEQIVPNLSAFLKGEYQPQNDKERIQFFDACFFRKLYVTAASLYAAADPKLTDYLRYNAARCAAQASIGQGKDAAKLDNKERARWRQQALAWLRAELDRWNKRLEGGQPTNRQRVRSFLEQWQRDTDLVGVREADALKKLSAEEQEAWRKLWADVAELLKKSL